MANPVIAIDWTLADVTLVMDTVQYASGDLMSAVVEIPKACLGGRGVILESLSVTDNDDQGGSMEFLLTGESISMGTVNAAFAIAQTDSDAIQARIPIASGDFADYGSFRFAQYGPAATGLGRVLQGREGASLWIGAISRDTKTHTASGVTLHMGFKRPAG